MDYYDLRVKEPHRDTPCWTLGLQRGDAAQGQGPAMPERADAEEKMPFATKEGALGTMLASS